MPRDRPSEATSHHPAPEPTAPGPREVFYQPGLFKAETKGFLGNPVFCVFGWFLEILEEVLEASKF